jgi:hypothetical protein
VISSAFSSSTLFESAFSVGVSSLKLALDLLPGVAVLGVCRSDEKGEKQNAKAQSANALFLNSVT